MLHAHLYGYGINRGGGAVPTYALLGDGALYGDFATTQVLASGDTITVNFANTYDNSGGAAPLRFIDGVDLSARRTDTNQTTATPSKINRTSSVITSGTLNGSAITFNTTECPTDGLIYEMILTLGGAADLDKVLTNYNVAVAATGRMAIISIITNTAARGEEGWFFNGSSTTVVSETLLGTGSDINLIGVAAEDFVTVPL